MTRHLCAERGCTDEVMNSGDLCNEHQRVLYCPQCGGKTKEGPKVVIWHRSCPRCKTRWFINKKGTWEPYNSKIKKKWKRASVAKRQREFEKRFRPK